MTRPLQSMERLVRRFPRVATGVAIGVGAISLAGRLLDLPGLPLGETLPTMHPNTAVMAVLAGVALWTLARAPLAPRSRRLGKLCAVLVVVLGSVTVVAGFLGLERLLPAPWPGGRSSLQTGFAFAALGTSLLAIDRGRLAEYAALVALAIANLALLGYLFGVPILYGRPHELPHVGMSIPTAVVVIGLALGILAARADRSIVAVVLADDPGGVAARRMLGGMLAFPIVAAVLLGGAHAGWYTLSFASAVVMLLALAHTTGLILSTANRLSRADVVVRDTEARVRLLIEQASDAIFIADLDGRYVDVNNAGCRMLGYTRAEIVGKTIVDLLPAEEVPLLAESKARLQAGAVEVGEWHLRCSDGTYLPVEVSAKILPDGRWQGIVRDITEREQIQRALAFAAELERAQRAELEALLGAVSDTVGELPRTDLDSVLRAIAEHVRALTAATSAAIGIGDDPERPFDHWVAVGMPEIQQTFGRGPLLDEARKRGEVIRMSDVPQHPALRGHPLITSLLAVPIKRFDQMIGTLYLANKQNAPEFSEEDSRLATALADRVAPAVMTATRFAMETTLRSWLQSVIDQLPEGVVVVNERGDVKAINRAMFALVSETTGIASWTSVPSFELYDRERQPVPIEDRPLVRALGGETVREQEFLLRREDGHMVPIVERAGPLRDEHHHITGAVVVVTDISERKELERSRDEWIAVVAHDLRQPLNTILLWGDRLKSLATDDNQRAAIERISGAGWRLNRMIQDLLDAARIAATRLAIEPLAADLAETVRDAIDTVQMSFPKATFQLTGSDYELAWFDRDRILQVLGNLLSNAAKYGAPGRPVRIEIASYDRFVEVSIITEGAPLSVEERERLFARFSRTQRARSSGIPGIGLGLYISKGLIEAHGGRIWVDSSEGSNAFRFTLPRPPE